MVDSVKVLSSINRADIVNTFNVKRMAVVVDAKDIPKYDKDKNPAGFKENEKYRFVESPKSLIGWGVKTDSEAYKYISGAFKGARKYANFEYLPSLSADLEVVLIPKPSEEDLVEAINKANLSMNFQYYGLLIVKSLYKDLPDAIKTFSNEYFIAIEDDSYFGDIAEPSFKKPEDTHIFDDILSTSVPVSLNYQIPKERGKLELPLSAVLMGYSCAIFGTQRPGVDVYFKKLEGVTPDNLPGFIISKLDVDLQRKINTFRMNEGGGAYKWNNLANGESAWMKQLIKYAEKVIKTNNENLLRSAISYNDSGFKEIKEEVERFLGLLLRAGMVNDFEVSIPKFLDLSQEDREKKRFAYSAKITVGGVTKELDLYAIWSN